MWEWMMMAAQRMASTTGLREPAAKGATVRGMSPAATNLDHQYCQLFANLCFTPNRGSNTFRKSSDSCHALENWGELAQHRSLTTIYMSASICTHYLQLLKAPANLFAGDKHATTYDTATASETVNVLVPWITSRI